MPHLRLRLLPNTAAAIERGALTHADGTIRVPLVERPLLLGRGKHCDIVVSDGRIAREDTVFEPSPEGWVARNLGNNQGMYVNGQKARRTVLRDGDAFFLPGVAFIYVADDGPPPAPG